ncbi:MAG: phosphatidate cytidylyltransferase [Gammaproteobacteria bacterium]|nr:phosphatidate cytidylyltransferase [Gammaproteobacteria bacterium]
MWKRIVTGLILAPAFLLAMFYLPVSGVQILIGVILVGVIWEAALLAGFRLPVSRYLFVSILIITGSVLVIFVPVTVSPVLYLGVAGIAGIWWLVDCFVLAQFSVERPGLYGSKTGRTISISLIMVSTWLAINALLIQDSRPPLLLVYVVVMVWIADSGAYFAGRFLGSHKLAVHVSPGKTIEGVVGGMIAVAIYAWISGSQVFHFENNQLVLWLALSIVASLISVVGDLNESALKRVMGKKDSGNIIPGHGGFFDRADAITAAVPVFYFGWRILDMGRIS